MLRASGWLARKEAKREAGKQAQSRVKAEHWPPSSSALVARREKSSSLLVFFPFFLSRGRTIANRLRAASSCFVFN